MFRQHKHVDTQRIFNRININNKPNEMRKYLGNHIASNVEKVLTLDNLKQI